MKKALEKQIGGDHYKAFAIQPIEFIARNNLPYREGCVIKYVSRHAAKNGAEDIKKAIHILEMILEDYATAEESSEDRTVKESLTVDGEKTIREWLEELPAPYRQCALMETETDRSESGTNTRYPSIGAALFCAFTWTDSVLNWQCWSKLYTALNAADPLPDSKPFWECLRTLAKKRLPEGWEINREKFCYEDRLHFDLITLKWINIKDHGMFEIRVHDGLVARRVVKDSLTSDIAIRNLPEGYTFLGRGPFKLEQGRQWFRGRVWLEKAHSWSSETDIIPTNNQHIVCTKTKSVIALNKPKS